MDGAEQIAHGESACSGSDEYRPRLPLQLGRHWRTVEVSIIKRVVPAERRTGPGSLAASCSPSMPVMCMSRIASAKGCFGPACLDHQVERLLAALCARHVARASLRAAAAGSRRFVWLSSTTRTRAPSSGFSIRVSRRGARDLGNLRLDEKPRTLSRGAFHPDAAPHQSSEGAGKWPDRDRCRRIGASSNHRPARTIRRPSPAPRAQCRYRCPARTDRSCASSSVCASSATRTTTSPASVNLIALPTRLASTWRRRNGSPRKPGSPASAWANWAAISSPLALRRLGEHRQRIFDQVAPGRSRPTRSPNARPRSSRNQGCR